MRFDATNASSSLHARLSFDENPKLRYILCDEMEAQEPGWKIRRKSKVIERKWRQVFHVPFPEFIGKKGPYRKSMMKMLSHKQDVILLGKKINTEPRHEYVRMRNGKAMLMTRDFMERQGLAAKVNNQMQFGITRCSLNILIRRLPLEVRE